MRRYYRDNDVLILRKYPSESRAIDLAEGCALVSHGQGVLASGAGRVAHFPAAAWRAAPDLRFDNPALLWRA